MAYHHRLTQLRRRPASALGVAIAALAASASVSLPASAQTAAAKTARAVAASAGQAGGYRSGDFHNHTTCTDGSTSTATLARKSLTYLDWFIDAGHSGSGNRDCRLDDFAYNGPADGQGDFWVNTIGADAIEGDVRNSTSYGAPAGTRAMWRWQSLLQFTLPDIRAEGVAAKKPAFLGLEWTVPGHEHASIGVISNQFDANPDSTEQAKFEYCFGRPSDDTSQGGGRGWTCEISAANNQKLIDRFTGEPLNVGNPDYNSTLGDNGINVDDNGDHVKSTAAMFWLAENNPRSSYSVQAHLERAGGFRERANSGYNIEQIRDWNNAAPEIAFGFESEPGHQAAGRRGEYSITRNPPTVGFFTYGGTGCWSAAEASRPGLRFDGTPLVREDFLPGGEFEAVNDNVNIKSVVLCRPGIRTAWDALLSEGRRFWYIANSDWHNRGQFAPFDEMNRSTFDFWPGEHQKTFTFIVNRNPENPAQDIVDALRSGNTWTSMGDLVDQVSFTACVANRCATMGQTLKVNPGETVTVRLNVRDPSGANPNIPYAFPNPALTQIGISEPLNRPSLKQVDLIKGVVSGLIQNTNNEMDEYRNPLAPATTVIAKSWTTADWSRGPWKRMTYTIPNVRENLYVRARGSNLPAGTPNERDANHNPLRDDLADNIACSDPACPPHVNGKFDFDVEGWGDLWFHANPIFIEVAGPVAITAKR